MTIYLKVTGQNIAFIAPQGGCFQCQNGCMPVLWLEVPVLLFFLCRVKAEVSCLSSFVICYADKRINAKNFHLFMPCFKIPVPDYCAVSLWGTLKYMYFWRWAYTHVLMSWTFHVMFRFLVLDLQLFSSQLSCVLVAGFPYYLFLF